MEERFKQAEDQYFRLKGRLTAGRISPAEFEAALQDLMVQDAQGRWWMLGAENGKWYVNDGKSWVPAQPPAGNIPPPPTLPVSAAPGRATRSLNPGLVTFVVVFLLAVIGVGALLVLNPGALTSARLVVTATPPPANAAASTAPAALPSPSQTASAPVVSETRSLEPPTAAPTNTPLTAATLTATEPPSATLPATAPPTLTATLPRPSPTNSATVKPVVVVRQATPTLGATATAEAPPGVYVTNMRVDPTEPKNLQLLTFYPTYLNTTGASRNYRLCVELFSPDNLKKSFGITPCSDGSVPTGSTEVGTNPNYRIVRGGECIPLVARAVYIDPSNARVPFLKPDGNVYWFGFQVCP